MGILLGNRSSLKIENSAKGWMLKMSVSQKISVLLSENERAMGQCLPIHESFDLIQRKIQIGGRRAVFYFVDGMMKEESIVKVMDTVFQIQEKDMPEQPSQFIEKYIPSVEADLFSCLEEAIQNVLAGVTVLFIDGYDRAIAIDCRSYPSRSVEEPEKDKSLRGSRDGFVETLVFDTAMIRRRIRDPRLIMEIMNIGKSSRSDVVIAYMKNLVDETLLNSVKEKLKAIKMTDLCMTQQSLATALVGSRWYNPFPKCKLTERPDTTAACLMEGKIAILVDNSPSVMILPTSVLDMIEEANDYYFPAWTSLYLKFSRTLILLLTVFLTPIFLLFMEHPQWIPEALHFILVQGNINIPLIYQFLILELSIDGLRLAAMNTPSMLSTPLSIFAGLVLGEFSVSSGWFNAEIMVYMAFVAVANYTQPNFELGYAVKFMRIILLILTAAFDWPGFVAGCVLVIFLVCSNQTLINRNYLHVSKN